MIVYLLLHVKHTHNNMLYIHINPSHVIILHASQIVVSLPTLSYDLVSQSIRARLMHFKVCYTAEKAQSKMKGILVTLVTHKSVMVIQT